MGERKVWEWSWKGELEWEGEGEWEWVEKEVVLKGLDFSKLKKGSKKYLGNFLQSWSTY